MMRYRKKPVVVEAVQWHENGDHPDDFPPGTHPVGAEGRVVRRFRRPDIDGRVHCEECFHPYHHHGWIDTLEGGHRVCPGDYIITGVAGEHYPCKANVFMLTYEPAEGGGER